MELITSSQWQSIQKNIALVLPAEKLIVFHSVITPLFMKSFCLENIRNFALSIKLELQTYCNLSWFWFHKHHFDFTKMWLVRKCDLKFELCQGFDEFTQKWSPKGVIFVKKSLIFSAAGGFASRAPPVIHSRNYKYLIKTFGTIALLPPFKIPAYATRSPIS